MGLQEDPDRTGPKVGGATRIFVVVAAALLVTSCAGKTVSTVAIPSVAPTGVSGSVVAGPTCPVERPDKPCPPRPVTGATVTANPSGKSAHTDGNGKFVLELSPGTYDLTVSSRGVMHCSDQRVQVTAHHYTHVTLNCDTGIR